MSARVLCYGGICVDNIIHVPYMPTPGIATTPTHQELQLGGGAALTAVWLAEWQIPVALTGNAIGTDAYGQQILEWLSVYNSFDTHQVQQRANVDTPYTRAIVPPDGDRYLIEVGYDTAPMYPAGSVKLDDIEILTVNFYYNNPERETARLAERAHARGITVVASDVLDADNPLFGYSDILINSRAVMAKKLPGVDHEAYLVALQAQHGGIIIMTDGENPVQVIDREGRLFGVRVPEVTVYNATGAGDAFRAGVVYGQLVGWTLEESVKLAVAAGTTQVQTKTTPAPLKDVQAVAQTLMIKE